ncbi:hypothetical protein GCM10029964_114400 [Kibdelosporangium lantanae]
MFSELVPGNNRPALRFGAASLTYGELAVAAGGVADRIRHLDRVAVWAEPTVETAVAVVGALVAGVAVVPVNPKVGSRELAHILTDSAPDLVYGGPDVGVARAEVDLDTGTAVADEEFPGERPAFVVYTSGTTGPPKGSSCPAGPSSPIWTPWRWRGSGRPTTCLSTPCRCSTSTA